jgi:hypothetical protein
MSDHQHSPPPRHYIVVVHGMGEQRHNETTVEVVHRFATARATNEPESPYAALLPASLSSLSMRRKGGGYGWSEFQGIPVDPSASLSPSDTFDGTRATDTAGKNFRFVDMRWADILQAHQDVFGSATKHWTTSLLARLDTPFTPHNWLGGKRWVRPLLEKIDQTLLPIQGLLKWYAPAIEQTIFRDIFGDVHLYGDYARTRGQAVRRFHSLLDQIHLRDYIQWCRFERTSKDEPYVPPVYTIIAHSLGSVLSFDALLYACAKESIRDGTNRHVSGSIPFPGYTEPEDYEKKSWLGLLADLMKPPRNKNLPGPEENWARFAACYPQFSKQHNATLPTASPTSVSEIPLLLWRDRVKQFITLGSPIDKFLTLWHHNYRHVGLRYPSAKAAWCKDWLDESIKPCIAHFNLCDEQDPVGHHLDVTRECEVYNDVFRTDIPVLYRDVVFRRYAVPGLAHVQYWKDQKLFRRVIKQVIDKPLPSQGYCSSQSAWGHLKEFVSKEFVEVDGVYDAALVWAYIRIPLIASVITGLLLSYGWIGWWYGGFSLASLLALFAGVLLWTCPRPFEGYRKEAHRKEAKPDPLAGRNWLSWLWMKMLPWRPRRGLFANFVAGSVAWRRILISLNVHDKQTTKVAEAEERKVRLSLETVGHFRRVFWPRVRGGGLLWGLALAGTWCGRTYLCAAKPPFLYAATLAVLTLSTVYLCAMAYVAYTFTKMKKAMAPASTTQPDQLSSSCSAT